MTERLHIRTTKYFCQLSGKDIIRVDAIVNEDGLPGSLPNGENADALASQEMVALAVQAAKDNPGKLFGVDVAA